MSNNKYTKMVCLIKFINIGQKVSFGVVEKEWWVDWEFSGQN